MGVVGTADDKVVAAELANVDDTLSSEVLTASDEEVVAAVVFSATAMVVGVVEGKAVV